MTDDMADFIDDSGDPNAPSLFDDDGDGDTYMSDSGEPNPDACIRLSFSLSRAKGARVDLNELYTRHGYVTETTPTTGDDNEHPSFSGELTMASVLASSKTGGSEHGDEVLSEGGGGGGSSSTAAGAAAAASASATTATAVTATRRRSAQKRHVTELYDADFVDDGELVDIDSQQPVLKIKGFFAATSEQLEVQTPAEAAPGASASSSGVLESSVAQDRVNGVSHTRAVEAIVGLKDSLTTEEMEVLAELEEEFAKASATSPHARRRVPTHIEGILGKLGAKMNVNEQLQLDVTAHLTRISGFSRQTVRKLVSRCAKKPAMTAAQQRFEHERDVLIGMMELDFAQSKAKPYKPNLEMMRDQIVRTFMLHTDYVHAKAAYARAGKTTLPVLSEERLQVCTDLLRVWQPTQVMSATDLCTYVTDMLQKHGGRQTLSPPARSTSITSAAASAAATPRTGEPARKRLKATGPVMGNTFTPLPDKPWAPSRFKANI